MKPNHLVKALLFSAVSAAVSACSTSPAGIAAIGAEPAPAHSADVNTEKFQQDRSAILAMTGDYDVSFDFIETVSFQDGYTPKERYTSGAHEVVRVIEDRGTFISLQHILVVGGDEKVPVKHWRQDWTYEPDTVLTFVGGNAWEMQPVPASVRAGQWSQVVYQVDDSPRYGAVGSWSHDHGVSDWTPPAAMRPLPRRDMTKRDDYHAVLAMNRHAITPEGWVHEQDNTKLILSGDLPQALVREIGVNTYRKTADIDVSVATEYWSKTADFWANVRTYWTSLERGDAAAFALTLKGEPTELYSALLSLALDVQNGDLSVKDASADAAQVINTYTTTQLGALQTRLRSAGR